MSVRSKFPRLTALLLSLALLISCLPPVSAAVVPKAQNKAVPINDYQQIIFVGDSRTVYLGQDLNRLGYNKNKKMQFIARKAQGYQWLVSTAYPKLLSTLKAAPTCRKAVIFNFGINDLMNISSYITYLNQIADTLYKYNCDLYYMSVNPTDNPKCLAYNHPPRDENLLAAFNQALQTSLDKRYIYLDTISFLNRKLSEGKLNSGNFTEDGLHFTEFTNKYIYSRTNYILQNNIQKITPRDIKKSGSGKKIKFTNKNGRVLKSRWLTYGNYTYYVNASGYAQTGYTGGYFFDNYGRLYRSQWIKYGKNYYYADVTGKKKTNCWVQAFRLDSGGRYVGTR